MVPFNTFHLLPMQQQKLIQPDCPIYVHCSRCCTETRTGAAFAQVRMLNRSARTVTGVYLKVEGLNTAGHVDFVIDEVVLTGLNAGAHAVFGEEYMISLLGHPASKLRITVRRVVYADGQLWRMRPSHKILKPKAPEWVQCGCGFWNLRKTSRCDLCGRDLAAPSLLLPQQNSANSASAPSAAPQPLRPAPIVRQMPPKPSEEVPKHLPGWALFLICTAAALTLAALALLAVFYLELYSF